MRLQHSRIAAKKNKSNRKGKVMQRVFGYARVSSKEQNLDRQIDRLKQFVLPENILMDKASGRDLERSAYQALKGTLGLRAGDTLIITSLDRLSRSKADIRRELQWFQDHGIRLKVLDLPTSLVEVPEGQEWIVEMINHILIEVLASMAEQERLLIKKRQREGIEAAQKKGKHLGRPRMQVPEEFPEVYARWRAGQISAKSAMKMLRMAKTSFYRLVNQYEGCAVPKGVE